MPEDRLAATSGRISKPKRTRINFTAQQLETMEAVFARTQYPDVAVLETMGTTMDLGIEKVCTWFQNRRSKFRRESKKGHINWMHSQLFTGSGPQTKAASTAVQASPGRVTPEHVLSNISPGDCDGRTKRKKSVSTPQKPYCFSNVHPYHDYSPMTSSITPHVTALVTPCMTSSLTPRMTSSFTPRMTSSLTPHMTSSLTPRMTSSLTPRMTSSLTPHMTSLTSHMTSSLTPCMMSSLNSHITSSLTPHITSSLTPHMITSSLTPLITSSLTPLTISPPITSPDTPPVMSPPMPSTKPPVMPHVKSCTSMTSPTSEYPYYDYGSLPQFSPTTYATHTLPLGGDEDGFHSGGSPYMAANPTEQSWSCSQYITSQAPSFYEPSSYMTPPGEFYGTGTHAAHKFSTM